MNHNIVLIKAVNLDTDKVVRMDEPTQESMLEVIKTFYKWSDEGYRAELDIDDTKRGLC